MKLSAVSSIPAAKKGMLVAALVSPENWKAVEEVLKSKFDQGISLKAEDGEPGAQKLHICGDSLMVCLGLGAAEKISLEGLRKAAHSAVGKSNEFKAESLFLYFLDGKGKASPDQITALSETVVLSNYQFSLYKTEKGANTLKEVKVFAAGATGKAAVERGRILGEVTCIARDLVNEPVITLTAEELSKRADSFGKKYGYKTETLNKAKIQALKMGGLLGVNYGSPLPPTFTIMEWKPKKPKNRQPVVLVGKGVVFDTGGLSLKETPGSMDSMKSDMAGAAAVVGAMCGAAALDLPIHLIGIFPATDNRPGGNAVTPGDVIRIMDGTTVEVLNTDAEGRLILADALAYASKFNPELVIDLATLTGAAVIAVGNIGTAMMATADEKVKSALKESGERVYERLVELPLWDEYKDMIKSDIADLKNIGGRSAGSITAGKFLQHFTKYPWVHLDIAGPSFLPGPDSYRGKNGTGVGVRLLLDFLSNY